MFGKKKKANKIGIITACVCAVVCACVGAYFVATSTSTVGEWERVSITLCPTRAEELSSGEVELINAQLMARHFMEPMEIHFEGDSSGGRGYNSRGSISFSWSRQVGSTRNDDTTITIIEDGGQMRVMVHDVSRSANFPRMTLNLTIDGNEVREVWEFMRVRR